jgi:two-component system KDP operon response regulator KdpE
MSEREPRPPDRFLVIEDEPQIRRVLRRILAEEAGTVLQAETGREGIDLAAARRPALIVLDLGLPDMQGIEVCTEIRRWSTAPIIVLSAHHSDAEKVCLLDAGADDFITKPFSTGELTARVRAVLRRARTLALPESEPILADGDLLIDLAARRVARGGRPVHLTPIEWSLLRAFLSHAGKLLTHNQLFTLVWGRAHGNPQQYLRVYVASLRRKIEGDPLRPRIILTEPGVGYRFDLGQGAGEGADPS